MKMKRLSVLLLTTLLVFVSAIGGIACDSSDDNENGTSDTIAPIISGITISDITETTATISWTTDESTANNIEYGSTTSYDYSFPSPTDNTADTTSHSLALSDLSPDTIYHFQVKSTDASGNETISDDYNFTTSPLPPYVAILSGQPPGTVGYSTADIIVAGSDVVSYKYKLDDSVWSAEIPASTHIILSDLVTGLHTISVVGKDAAGSWQPESSSTTTSWTVETIVIFPDANLEEAIKVYIGKPQGDIYQSDLERLTELDASGRGIVDLTGIEYCTSLTVFYLGAGLMGNNQISDLTPLSSLTSLTELHLDNNQISDLMPLSSLTSLTWLGFDYNQISDLMPLSSLTSLTSLDLGNNQIRDLSPLSSLTSLNELSLYNNQISDLSSLSSLTGLTFAYLAGNQVNDLSSLSSLISLTRLIIPDNQIRDLSPLSFLTGLNELSLYNNQISDIEPLVNNPGLGQGDHIYLTDNPLSTTSVDTYIPELEVRGVSVYSLTP